MTSRTGTALRSLAIVGGLAAAGPAVPQETLFRNFLGLPAKETRPPERAFVLPSTDGVVASEIGPSLRGATNSYGMPGLIDMPTAQALPDGEIQATISSFAGLTRNTLTFQITPRLTGAFRYNRFADIDFAGFEDYYDRAFDIQYQLMAEDGWRPAVAVGLRDLKG